MERTVLVLIATILSTGAWAEEGELAADVKDTASAYGALEACGAYMDVEEPMAQAKAAVQVMLKTGGSPEQAKKSYEEGLSSLSAMSAMAAVGAATGNGTADTNREICQSFGTMAVVIAEQAYRKYVKQLDSPFDE